MGILKWGKQQIYIVVVIIFNNKSDRILI